MAEKFHGIFHTTSSDRRHSRPNFGIDLRLHDLPSYVNARDLKAALSKELLPRLDYDYAVILEKTAEEIFWTAFDGYGGLNRMTASVSVPNYPNLRRGENEGSKLINTDIEIQYRLAWRASRFPPSQRSAYSSGDQDNRLENYTRNLRKPSKYQAGAE